MRHKRPLAFVAAFLVWLAMSGAALAANNLTMTSPTYDTSTPKFGSAALSGGYGVTSANVDPTAGFAMEAWVKTSASGSSINILGNYNAIANFGMNAAGYATATIGHGSASTNLTLWGFGATNTAIINNGVWHHLVVSSAQNDYSGGRFYVDGAAQPVAAQIGGFVALVAPAPMTVHGDGGTGDNSAFEIDEVVFWASNKYTASSITPPTGPYAGSAGMEELYHLDSNGLDSVGAAVGITFFPGCRYRYCAIPATSKLGGS